MKDKVMNQLQRFSKAMFHPGIDSAHRRYFDCSGESFYQCKAFGASASF